MFERPQWPTVSCWSFSRMCNFARSSVGSAICSECGGAAGSHILSSAVRFSVLVCSPSQTFETTDLLVGRSPNDREWGLLCLRCLQPLIKMSCARQMRRIHRLARSFACTGVAETATESALLTGPAEGSPFTPIALCVRDVGQRSAIFGMPVVGSAPFRATPLLAGLDGRSGFRIPAHGRHPDFDGGA